MRRFIGILAVVIGVVGGGAVMDDFGRCLGFMFFCLIGVIGLDMWMKAE